MQLHIVRHGQTYWNKERRIQGQLDSELDDSGQQQASDRGADFANMRLMAAYSSSSLRTRQTIQLILGERKDVVTLRDDLREVNLGVWQGELWDDIHCKHPDMVEAHRTASPSFNVEGAESLFELQERGVTAIEDIIKQHSGNHAEPLSDAHILIVSHGAIMKTILAQYAEIPLSHLHLLPPLPNCAHCIIEIMGDKRKVSHIAGQALTETPWAQPSKLKPENEAFLSSPLPAV